jgi:hypothetical protein
LDVDIPKPVVGYLRIRITTLKVFKGSVSRTLSGKYLRNRYLPKTTKEYYQAPHLEQRGELSCSRNRLNKCSADLLVINTPSE